MLAAGIGLGLGELGSGLANVCGEADGEGRVVWQGACADEGGAGWRGRVCEAREEEAAAGEDCEGDVDDNARGRRWARAGSTTPVARMDSLGARVHAQGRRQFSVARPHHRRSLRLDRLRLDLPRRHGHRRRRIQQHLQRKHAQRGCGGVRGMRTQAQTPHIGAVQALYDGAGRRLHILAGRRRRTKSQAWAARGRRCGCRCGRRSRAGAAGPVKPTAGIHAGGAVYGPYAHGAISQANPLARLHRDRPDSHGTSILSTAHSAASTAHSHKPCTFAAKAAH
ncbi:hypothetical protein C8J57DRAFT_1220147 [Mycena rebaudengoi]|nr:hypothetical protein C8J57DRAFT_1220147 [Mycena rebaudengoi]